MKFQSLRRALVTFLTAAALCSGCTSDREPDQPATAEVIRISEHEYVHEHAGRGILVDVRRPDEFAEGHLVGARHINVLSDEFRSQVDQLDRDSTYYLYCRTGNRSGQAAEIMADMGFQSLYNVGGYADLARAGADTTR